MGDNKEEKEVAGDVKSEDPQDQGGRGRGGRGRGRGRGRGEGGRGRGPSNKELFPDVMAVIEDLTAQIEGAYNEINRIRAEILKCKGELDVENEKRDELNVQIKQKRNESGDVIQLKKKKDEQKKSLRESIIAKNTEMRTLRQQLPRIEKEKDQKKEKDQPFKMDQQFFEKVHKAYEDERRKLELRIEQNLSRPEEQKILRQIKDLTKDERTITTRMKELSEQVEKEQRQLDALRKLADKDRDEINQVKGGQKELTDRRNEIERLKGGILSRRKDLIAQEKELRDNIAQWKTEREEQRDQLTELRDEYHANQRAEYEKQQQKRKEQYEARKKRREEYEQKKAEEEAARVPLEAELLECEAVVDYFLATAKRFNISLEAGGSSSSSSSGGKGKKKNQKKQKKQKEVILTHPKKITDMAGYLKIKLPLLPGEIPALHQAALKRWDEYKERQQIEIRKKNDPTFVAPEEEKEEEEEPAVEESAVEESAVEESAVEESAVAEDPAPAAAEEPAPAAAEEPAPAAAEEPAPAAAEEPAPAAAEEPAPAVEEPAVAEKPAPAAEKPAKKEKAPKAKKEKAAKAEKAEEGSSSEELSALDQSIRASSVPVYYLALSAKN